MKTISLIVCFLFLSNLLYAQINPIIVYDTINPSFWNNLKITYSIKHSQRFKDRLIIKNKINLSQLRYNIILIEKDPMLSFKKLSELNELNDSQILIIGRCKVTKIDYKMVEIAKTDSEHYKLKRKWLIRRFSYDSISRFRLYIDSSGKQYVKYSTFKERYIMDKRYIENCRITNLNIWVNTKKEANKKRRHHFIKTFALSFTTAYLSLVGLVYLIYPPVE